jgi:hypothetical protein
MKTIAAAGNTVVPAILALEVLGFDVFVEAVGEGQTCRAVRGDECYSADDPVTVLGLIKLVEARGWDWHPDDQQLGRAIQRYGLG